MRLTREGTGFEGEALLRKKDGGTFFVNLSTALYKGDSTGHEIAIVTLQDITHLKQMEKEYLGSERFSGLGMMTDQISHQIRNPIVSIGGFAMRLARDQALSNEYAQYSKIIHSEAKRLEYIIDRLVEFARVYPNSYAALTLSEFFEEARKACSAGSDGQAGAVQFPAPEVLPAKPLFGDLPLLTRALQCVIQNSLEAISQDGGRVTVDGSIIEDQVVVRVKDNGEGIRSENLAFVFDPFFTTKFNYMGLGLTMARRIVQEHKGRIDLDSVAGKGTEVRIILPRDRRREIRRKLL